MLFLNSLSLYIKDFLFIVRNKCEFSMCQLPATSTEIITFQLNILIWKVLTISIFKFYCENKNTSIFEYIMFSALWIHHVMKWCRFCSFEGFCLISHSIRYLPNLSLLPSFFQHDYFIPHLVIINFNNISLIT